MKEQQPIQAFQLKIIQRETTNPKLKENPDVSVLIEKFLKQEGGAPLDVFDGKTVELLKKVMSFSEDHSKILGFLSPIFLGNSKPSRFLRSVFPKIAGFYGGGEIGQFTGNWAEGATREYVLAEGNRVIQETLLKNPFSFDTKNETSWLLGKLKEYANGATDYITKQVKPYIESTFKSFVETGANWAGDFAGYVMTPVGAIGGYLAVSSGVGATLELSREIKRSTGFELLSGYIERSQKMIESGQKNENGLDPRVELIALGNKILEDSKKMGHSGVTNEEWLILAGEIRKARLSLLEDEMPKEGPQGIWYTPKEKEEFKTKLEQRSEIVLRFLKKQEELAEGEMEEATRILGAFNEKLKKDLEHLEGNIENQNTFLKKNGRYAKAFVRGGIEGTGIPFMMRIMARPLIFAAKRMIPGGRLLFKR